MTKTMTKSFAAALFAALFALLMVPNLAFANTLGAGSIGAQEDDDVVFFVQAKYLEGYEADEETGALDAKYSDAVVLKKYTASDLQKLAGSAKDEPVAALYNTSKIYASKNYIPTIELLADAGIENVADGELVSFLAYKKNTTTGETEEYTNSKQNFYGMYGSDLRSETKFFPNATKTEVITEDAIDAPSVIALTFAKADISDTGTAKKALEDIAAYPDEISVTPTATSIQHIVGQTLDNLETAGIQGGFRQASSLVGLNVYVSALDRAKVDAIPDQTYTGSAITPAVTVKFDGGEALKAGTDYDVAYVNNTQPGTATVTITGKGDYSGSLKVSFTIKDTAAHASNINTSTVSASQIKAASALGATSITLGKGVKKIAKNAFKGTKIKTVTITSTKLKKSGIKNALKGSKVKTIKVKVGSKKQNKKYVKKYKKIFTKKVCGKKVKVK